MRIVPPRVVVGARLGTCTSMLNQNNLALKNKSAKFDWVMFNPAGALEINHKW